jgi:SAM-dependent methyltransferase
MSGKDLLEIGFGKHSIPRRLVTDAGGTWTGIEPFMPTSQRAEFGKGGYGQVAEIPFDNCTFDVVTGIQTLEHWEEPLPGSKRTPDYSECLREVHRVLKPGGSIYFDAPIHLHGHEMFIVGDFARIRALLDPSLWQNMTIERWREDYAPLARFPTPAGEVATWADSVTSYPQELLSDIQKNRSVTLITISAMKKDPPG